MIKENTELKLQIEKFQKNNKEINKQRIMEKIFNKTIYEILQERGMTKCIELIKKNNLNVSMQPKDKAYQYSAQKVKDHVDKLKKNQELPQNCFRSA